MIEQNIEEVVKPKADSHKGQNGKLLIIGGSELFHAPLLWAAEVASRIVDMVHVTSPAEVNNRLMRERLKQKFWNGIVVPWDRVDNYIEEDDCVLIGPGMTRQEGLEPGEISTQKIVNELLSRYPKKRWVVDGGALQEVEEKLLNGQMMITPHQKEWVRFNSTPTQFSKIHQDLVILLKGKVDLVVRGEEEIEVSGGNEGMTKGGTGDVLAGMAAALATKNDLWVAAKLASQVNKLAGDRLYQKVGRFYNATDLVNQIPEVLQEQIG